MKHRAPALRLGKAAFALLVLPLACAPNPEAPASPGGAGAAIDAARATGTGGGGGTAGQGASGVGGGTAGRGGSAAAGAAGASVPAVDAPVPDVAVAPVPGTCRVDAQRMLADVRHLASAELRGRKPGDPGNELALKHAEAQFRAAGLAPAGEGGGYRQAFPFAPGQTAHNVLGVLRGEDAALGSEVILVGAHIDHLGVNRDGRINYGADDNASGAAVVMELGRMFGLCGVRPRRTVVFVEWNAEEMGLIGSKYYVEHPLFPLERTIAVYNFDMVGAGDSTGVLLFGGSDARNAWLTELMRGAATAARLPHVIQIVPQKLASDHAPFVQRGIPICWGFARPDPHPGYHTPDDDIDNVRPASLAAVAELFWAALRPLAMGEEDRYTRRPAAVAPMGPLLDLGGASMALPCSVAHGAHL